MIKPVTINNRRVGPGFPTYIVAEMSANHGQNFDEAVKIIEAAKNAGADAVKIQTYTPDTLTIKCQNDHFKIVNDSPWKERYLYDLYGEAYTPWEWQPKLKEITEKLEMDFFSTPFDASAVDFLEAMDMPAHKIASFEIVDIPLLRRVARTGKPVIMSTGMATLSEIDEAVQEFRINGGNHLILLKCNSAYPAPPEDMNLRTIPHLSETFSVPVGLSDHTMNIGIAVAAAVIGACIIEKHFTLSRKINGPDSFFSMEPKEFQAMVDAVRAAEKALGQVQYGMCEKESQNRSFRRSLFVVEDMKAGETFTDRNLRSIRPGQGLHTRYLGALLGRRAGCDIKRGTPVDWNLISKDSDIDRHLQYFSK